MYWKYFKNWESSVVGLRLQFLLSIDVAETFDSLSKDITQIKNQIHSFSYHELNVTFKQIRNPTLMDDNHIEV